MPCERSQWVGRHQRELWRFLRFLGCPPEVAEDVAQDTFIAALEHAVVELDDRAAGAWLRTMARNLYRMDLRRWHPVARADVVAIRRELELDPAVLMTADWTGPKPAVTRPRHLLLQLDLSGNRRMHFGISLGDPPSVMLGPTPRLACAWTLAPGSRLLRIAREYLAAEVRFQVVVTGADQLASRAADSTALRCFDLEVADLALLDRFEQLELLELELDPFAPDRTALLRIARMPKLHELRIGQLTESSVPFFREIPILGAHFRMRAKAGDWPAAANPEALIELANKPPPTLERLTPRSIEVHAALVAALAKLPRLARLELRSCKLVGLDPAVLASAPVLTELSLPNCRGVDDVLLARLATWKHLRRLDLTDAEPVPSDAVERLRAALPRCEIVRD